jgi:hypothetical protein
MRKRKAPKSKPAVPIGYDAPFETVEIFTFKGDSISLTLPVTRIPSFARIGAVVEYNDPDSGFKFGSIIAMTPEICVARSEGGDAALTWDEVLLGNVQPDPKQVVG